MPAYRVDHPEFERPRAIECSSPKAARQAVAKELAVKRISSAEAFDLSKQGVDLVTIGKG